MVGSSDAGRRQRRQARERSKGEAAGDEARVSSLYACAGGRSGAIGRRKMEIEKESGVERDTGGEEMGSWEEDGIGQRFLAARGKQGVGSGEGREWGSARVSSGADWAWPWAGARGREAQEGSGAGLARGAGRLSP